MKVTKECVECIENGEEDYKFTFNATNEMVYKVSCKKGHVQSITVPAFKYVVLFEFGVNAIVDGYYRESISSFAAALERYYEHFIKVVLPNSETNSFKEAWKQVKSHSERQLGAYIFIYFSLFGKKPNLLSNSSTNLRNEAIHKGLIPRKEQAIDFGTSVAKIINSGNVKLNKFYLEQLKAEWKEVMYPNRTCLNNPIHISGSYLKSFKPECSVDLGEYIELKCNSSRS